MPTSTRSRPRKPAAGGQAFDDAVWRVAYETGTYVVPGMAYEDYAPAFRYGVQLSDRHGGRTFAEVEPSLAHEWPAVQSTSRLSWEQALPAVRDGYAGVVRIRTERPRAIRRPVKAGKRSAGTKRAAATARKGGKK